MRLALKLNEFLWCTSACSPQTMDCHVYGHRDAMVQSIKDFTKHELADICPCGPLPPRTTRKRIHKQHWLSMADPYIAVTICNWQEGRDITQFTHFFCFFVMRTSLHNCYTSKAQGTTV